MLVFYLKVCYTVFMEFTLVFVFIILSIVFGFYLATKILLGIVLVLGVAWLVEIPIEWIEKKLQPPK